MISLAENLSPAAPADSATAGGDINVKGNDTHDADVWHAGISYDNGKVMLIGQFGERKDSKRGIAEKDGFTAWLAGLGLYLDKSFYLYSGYLEKKYNDDKDKDSRITIGASLIF